MSDGVKVILQFYKLAEGRNYSYIGLRGLSQFHGLLAFTNVYAARIADLALSVGSKE